MDKTKEIFGWVATGLTMCFYISPVIPFVNVFKGKLNYEDTPAIIVTTSYVNCFCWFIYGDIIVSDQIKICNLTGAISSGILISIYLIYEFKQYTLDAILNALILITGSYAAYRAITVLIDDDETIGKICNITAIIVFLSPIQLIYRVIKEKNFILIPIYTAYVSLVSASCWVTYGFLIMDYYVVFPNVIGIILAVVQIFVYWNYRRHYPTIGEKNLNNSIGIESTTSEEVKKEDNSAVDKVDVDISNNAEQPVKIVSTN